MCGIGLLALGGLGWGRMAHPGCEKARVGGGGGGGALEFLMDK